MRAELRAAPAQRKEGVEDAGTEDDEEDHRRGARGRQKRLEQRLAVQPAVDERDQPGAGRADRGAPRSA